MSNRRDLDFLADILEAIRRADEYVGDMDYKAFVKDTKTQDAVIRTIEIIGEATKRLSPELRDSNPKVPYFGGLTFGPPRPFAEGPDRISQSA